ncbi:2136_t:CDS:2 [Entrophospora sp. SA101]|nr:2136_t:CDS:2 [Entrophospora sp. SA101]
MKLYSITIFATEPNQPAINLAGEYDLSSFEFMTFFAKTVAERTKPGQRQSVEENSLTGIIICDNEYPQRVAFSLLNKILEDSLVKFPKHTWKSGGINYPELKSHLVKYQDPKQADQIMKVQDQLDETKLVMNKTIETLLQRGEKLDDLIDKSQEISFQSKAFYKQAKKSDKEHNYISKEILDMDSICITYSHQQSASHINPISLAPQNTQSAQGIQPMQVVSPGANLQHQPGFMSAQSQNFDVQQILRHLAPANAPNQQPYAQQTR